MTVRSTIVRLLTFRLAREDMFRFDKRHLVAGLCGTWIVGMGRYWDDPDALFLQHLGVGSVVYIFILAALIWLVMKPYWLTEWRYFTVLTFVSLTSFPAIIYAIPVEMVYPRETANQINAWFLAVVASWRFGLLLFFLKRFTQLNVAYIAIAALLPVCGIIYILTALNLEGAVFDIMGGIREEDRTSHDASYSVLILLYLLSMYLLPFLLIAYGVAIFVRYERSSDPCVR